ncbi:MAG TPA: tRNA (adenosine(37)-N6)-dimethylallyltransferase MiaA [Candidatus Acidoferrales bacterium]|nr:tRNA (adenosine(37)-N6)-dimethylallyltransferase MiaA [Candidatus Acidoferrales bacterium]
MNAAGRRLIVILGPTASGKSALAIALAEKLCGEIVCCDSTQVYRDFNIGTGKIPPEQQRGIPHHLTDLVDPGEIFTAGEYRRRAVETLTEITVRGKLPILTAGTGLYLRALLEGLGNAPARSETLRERLRQDETLKGPGYLHRILRRLDRRAASSISPGDKQKLIRAIEICLLSGKPVSEVHRDGRAGLEGYAVLKIGLAPQRAALYARIDQRVTNMIESGWVNEVRDLMKMGIPAAAKPFTFLGYSQLREHTQGAKTLEQAVRETQQATRQYAKRQITWFRREANVHWLKTFGDDGGVLETALELVRRPQE